MLILASSSPRRRDLLREAGYDFVIETVDVEEEDHAPDGVAALVQANAHLKAEPVAKANPEEVVIGADTLVALEGIPFGKPKSMEEAFSMLRELAGKTHTVLTGVAVFHLAASRTRMFFTETKVTFHQLSDAEIRAYHQDIEPLDKAGGYAAQDQGQRIIQKTEGSWTNVIGLPIEDLLPILTDFGIPAPPSTGHPIK